MQDVGALTGGKLSDGHPSVRSCRVRLGATLGSCGGWDPGFWVVKHGRNCSVIMWHSKWFAPNALKKVTWMFCIDTKVGSLLKWRKLLIVIADQDKLLESELFNKLTVTKSVWVISKSHSLCLSIAPP